MQKNYKRNTKSSRHGKNLKKDRRENCSICHVHDGLESRKEWFHSHQKVSVDSYQFATRPEILFGPRYIRHVTDVVVWYISWFIRYIHNDFQVYLIILMIFLRCTDITFTILFYKKYSYLKFYFLRCTRIWDLRFYFNYTNWA